MSTDKSLGRHEAPAAILARDGVDIDPLPTDAEMAARRESAHEDRHAVDGRLIARLRAEGLWHKEHAAHLGQALRTSRKIGAAVGIVMAGFGVGELEAFDILSRVSQDTNRKLSEIAHEVVDKGTATALPRR
jgi:hypothetical protein